jgi:hypothetical protein
MSHLLASTASATKENNKQILASHFLQEKDRSLVWQQSVEEYKARYKHFNDQEFTKQVKFLDRLLKLACQRKMKVILVNMPLTQDNLALMPSQLYRTYLHCVEVLADHYKVSFIDCESDPYYGTSRGFYDTVHLNGTGGMHFVQTLSSAIASKERLAVSNQQPM